jgi:hypothetical protein
LTDSVRQLGKHALVFVVFALLLPVSAAADLTDPVAEPSFPEVELRHCWDGPFSTEADRLHCGDIEGVDDLELPGALVGTGYAYRFASSLQSFTTFFVKEGDLPGGLSLDEDGLLFGVPTTAGHFSFVVLAHNHATGNTEQRVAIDVAGPPAPTPGPPETMQVLGESVVVDGRLPPPVAGKSFNLELVDGAVSTKCSDDGDFRKLDRPRQVTLDCQIDAERGAVSVTASKGKGRATQTAVFWGGVFDIDQEAGENREAVMTLAGQRRCEKRKGGIGRRTGQRNRRGSSGRKLWGSGSGNYKTAGSHGAATVRGTIWLVADRCDGSTLFKVKQGTVVVRDFVKDISVNLDAGQSYIARLDIDRLP